MGRAGIVAITGDPGIEPDDAGRAEVENLIAGESALVFRQQLVQPAVYNGASASDRRRVHRAPAAVTTDPQEADQRAGCRAAAATGPDEQPSGDVPRR